MYCKRRSTQRFIRWKVYSGWQFSLLAVFQNRIDLSIFHIYFFVTFDVNCFSYQETNTIKHSFKKKNQFHYCKKCICGYLPFLEMFILAGIFPGNSFWALLAGTSRIKLCQNVLKILDNFYIYKSQFHE